MKKTLSILMATAVLTMSASASAYCGLNVINLSPKSGSSSCQNVPDTVKNVLDSFGINLDIAKDKNSTNCNTQTDCKADSTYDLKTDCKIDETTNTDCKTDNFCEIRSAVTNSNCKTDNSCDTKNDCNLDNACDEKTDCDTDNSCEKETNCNTANTQSQSPIVITQGSCGNKSTFNKSEFIQKLLEKLTPIKVTTCNKNQNINTTPSITPQTKPVQTPSDNAPNKPDVTPETNSSAKPDVTPETNTDTEVDTPQIEEKPNANQVATDSFEEQVLALVNKERATYGLSPLSYSTELEAVAKKHSKDMAENGFFNHTNLSGQSPFDRIKAAGISYRVAAENIAAGQKTPQEVVKAWMNSSGHRKNILNSSVTKMGLGVYKGGSYGIYWTQLFIG